VEQGLREALSKGPCDHPVAILQERLWLNDPLNVADMYDAVILGGLDLNAPPSSGNGDHGLRAERMRELRRPLPYRRRRGKTLTEIAKESGIRRETLARLMEHYGFLELISYGGTQRRRLVTDQAFHAGLGHNVDASKTRVAAVEGRARAGVFPVFYAEEVPSLLWCLDYPGIVAAARAILNKRDRMRWLLTHHAYLPDEELAEMAGYSERGVRKARGLDITHGGTFSRLAA
jgi:hypothetical protein